MCDTIAGADADYATSIGNNGALKQVDIIQKAMHLSTVPIQTTN